MELQWQLVVVLGGRPPASGSLDLLTAGVGVGLWALRMSQACAGLRGFVWR